MKQFTISTLIIILFACNCSYGQTSNIKETDSLSFKEPPKKLSDIAKKIALINEVQSQHIGNAGIESDNYKNYLELKKVATTDDLLNLTYNQNAVVACYASMALADKSYSDLRTVFSKFLSHDRKVSTFSGCIKSKDGISIELYHEYWNNVEDKAKWTDKILVQLDSIILYHDNSDWLLMTRALENRVYPISYKKRIEELAFKKGNRESLFYLCNWYRADYYDKIKPALINYLKKTDFSKTGITDYYRTVDELLKFRDSEIDTLIVQKLKKDKHWKYDEQKFKSLLDDYSIYEDFD